MPVYNVEQYIECCLESILTQNFDKYELVLVDDGSTDSSGKICDKYADKYSFIKVIHKCNEGLYQARIDGARVAEGDYIWFIDSDDWVAEEALKKLYHLICTGNYPDVIIFGYSINGEQPFLFSKLFDKGEYTFNDKYEIYAELCEFDSLNPVWRKCIKRSLIVENKMLYDIDSFSYGEDSFISSTVIDCADRIMFSKDLLYFYRVNNMSMTQVYNPKRLHDQEISVSRLFELACRWDRGDERLLIGVFNKGLNELLENIRRIVESKLTWSQKQGLIDDILSNTFWRVFFEKKDVICYKQNKAIYMCLKMNSNFKNYAIRILYLMHMVKSLLKKILVFLHCI